MSEACRLLGCAHAALGQWAAACEAAERAVAEAAKALLWGRSRVGVERLLLREVGRLFRHGKYGVSVTRTKHERTRGQSLHVTRACM
jgi:hypothetical protein